MWHVAQPIDVNRCSPTSTAASMSGSFGITLPGTAIVAWNTETAVTSARVISLTNPSPSGSEHAERGARVRDGLQLRGGEVFPHFAACRGRIAGVERREIEPLAEHEDVGDDIAAASRDAER